MMLTGLAFLNIICAFILILILFFTFDFLLNYVNDLFDKSRKKELDRKKKEEIEEIQRKLNKYRRNKK